MVVTVLARGPIKAYILFRYFPKYQSVLISCSQNDCHSTDTRAHESIYITNMFLKLSIKSRLLLSKYMSKCRLADPWICTYHECIS